MLSFCLFDVYGVSQAGKIAVQNETTANRCPLLARCPEVAILFPNIAPARSMATRSARMICDGSDEGRISSLLAGILCGVAGPQRQASRAFPERMKIERSGTARA